MDVQARRPKIKEMADEDQFDELVDGSFRSDSKDSDTFKIHDGLPSCHEKCPNQKRFRGSIQISKITRKSEALYTKVAP